MLGQSRHKPSRGTPRWNSTLRRQASWPSHFFNSAATWCYTLYHFLPIQTPIYCGTLGHITEVLFLIICVFLPSPFHPSLDNNTSLLCEKYIHAYPLWTRPRKWHLTKDWPASSTPGLFSISLKMLDHFSGLIWRPCLRMKPIKSYEAGCKGMKQRDSGDGWSTEVSWSQLII